MTYIKRFFTLLIALIMLLPAAALAELAPLNVYFLDVGQADAAVLECGGHVMMIDGGNADDSRFIYSFLTNTLKVDHLDAVIATHPHEDHIGGLSAAFNACGVGLLISPVAEAEGKPFESMMKYATQQGLSVTIPGPGDWFTLGDATVQFVSSGKSYDSVNDTSLVVRITHGSNAFLFAADAERAAEADMIASGFDLSADVLKVGHHGGNSSSSADFLKKVNPRYAVISVGANNDYSHPTSAVLDRLAAVGANVLRTDLYGTILCVSDGADVSFYVEKITSATPAPAPEKAEEGYVGNRNSKKLHRASCDSVSDMSEKNKVFFDDRDEAVSQGYEPCQRCKP